MKVEKPDQAGFTLCIHDRDILVSPLAEWETCKRKPLTEAEIDKMRRLIGQDSTEQEDRPGRLEKSPTRSVGGFSNLGFNTEKKTAPLEQRPTISLRQVAPLVRTNRRSFFSCLGFGNAAGVAFSRTTTGRLPYERFSGSITPLPPLIQNTCQTVRLYSAGTRNLARLLG